MVSRVSIQRYSQGIVRGIHGILLFLAISHQVSANDDTEWHMRVLQERSLRDQLLRGAGQMEKDFFDEIVGIASKLPPADQPLVPGQNLKFFKVPDAFKENAGKWLDGKIEGVRKSRENVKTLHLLPEDRVMRLAYFEVIDQILQAEKDALEQGHFIAPLDANTWRQGALRIAFAEATPREAQLEQQNAEAAAEVLAAAAVQAMIEDLNDRLIAATTAGGRYQRMLERACDNPSRGNLKYLEKAAAAAGLEVPPDVYELHRRAAIENELATLEYQLRNLQQDLEDKERRMEQLPDRSPERESLANEMNRIRLEYRRAEIARDQLKNTP